MTQATPDRPDWNRLFETAAGQQGLFTTQQAAEAGYSPQLLVHYVQGGRAVRIRRGIYRLLPLPAGQKEGRGATPLLAQANGVGLPPTPLAPPCVLDVFPTLAELPVPTPAGDSR